MLRAFVPADRALPLAAVALLHVAALVALIHSPGLRRTLVPTPSLLVRLVASPHTGAPLPTSPPTPALREPAPVPLPMPRIDVQESETPIAPSVTAIPPRPSTVASASRAPVAIALDAPRFDVAYLRNPAPAYPPLSRRLHEQGRVVLRVRVTVNGDAGEIGVEASSGSERLDRAAVEAVRQWRFVPARRGNESVEGIALVPIDFSLEA